MGKKFVPVLNKSRVYKVFCDDIRKIYYLSKKARPVVPKYEESEETYETLSPMTASFLSEDPVIKV